MKRITAFVRGAALMLAGTLGMATVTADAQEIFDKTIEYAGTYFVD